MTLHIIAFIIFAYALFNAVCFGIAYEDPETEEVARSHFWIAVAAALCAYILQVVA